MKIKRSTVTWLALLMISAASWTDAAEIDVYFSPGGGVARAIAAEIGKAETSVSVMSYTISEPQICQALCRAKQRGICVRLIVNPTQEASRWSQAANLQRCGVIVRTDHRHTRMQNKGVIVDVATVCTGSANHSKSADRSNAENLVVIRNAEVAAKFSANFALHWNHSVIFNNRVATKHKRLLPDSCHFPKANRPRTKEY